MQDRPPATANLVSARKRNAGRLLGKCAWQERLGGGLGSVEALR